MLPDATSAPHGFAPSLFVALGVQPMLGRTFTEAEAEVDHPAPVMVLSHRLWQRRFGSDPGVLGKQVRLSGASLTIIGVMPPDFHYPLQETEYWVPLGINHFQLQGSARFFEVVARFVIRAAHRQKAGEIPLRCRIRRLDAQRFANLFLRVRGIAFLDQESGERTVHVRNFGIKLDGLHQIRFSFHALALRP